MSQSLENFHVVESAEQFKQLLSADLERISLLNFWASWAEPCGKMNEVVAELAKTNPRLLILQVCTQLTAMARFGVLTLPPTDRGRQGVKRRYCRIL